MWNKEKIGFDLLVARSDEYQNVLEILEKVVRFLPQRRKFLDVGAGNPTTLTDSVGKLFEETVIIEPNPEYLKLHKQRGHKIIDSTLELAMLEQNAFDLILCAHVLYYIPTNIWRQIIEKLYQSLASGGILAFVLHSKISGTYMLMKEMYGKELPVSAEKLEKLILQYFSNVVVYPYTGTISLKSTEEYNMLVEFLRESLPDKKDLNKVEKSKEKLIIDNSGKVIIVQKK